MKNNNNNNAKFWIIVILVALVAGLLGSFIGGKITGNVIKVNSLSKPYGLQEVYTKTEVDAKLKSVATNQGVLNMLSNKCYKISPRADLNNQCDKTCEAGFSIGKNLNAKGIAIGSFSGMFYTAIKQDGQKDLEFATTFDFGGVTQPMPSCGFDSANSCSQHIEEFMELEKGYNSTTSGIAIIGVDSRCICCVA